MMWASGAIAKMALPSGSPWTNQPALEAHPDAASIRKHNAPADGGMVEGKQFV